jgi:hypothetical protein
MMFGDYWTGFEHVSQALYALIKIKLFRLFNNTVTGKNVSLVVKKRNCTKPQIHGEIF